TSIRGGRAVGTVGQVGAESSEIHLVAARPRQTTRRGPDRAGAQGVPSPVGRQAGRVAKPLGVPRQSKLRPGWGSGGPRPGRASSGSSGEATRGPAPIKAPTGLGLRGSPARSGVKRVEWRSHSGSRANQSSDRAGAQGVPGPVGRQAGRVAKPLGVPRQSKLRPGWGSGGPQPGRASSGSSGEATRGPAPIKAPLGLGLRGSPARSGVKRVEWRSHSGSRANQSSARAGAQGVPGPVGRQAGRVAKPLGVPRQSKLRPGWGSGGPRPGRASSGSSGEATRG